MRGPPGMYLAAIASFLLLSGLYGILPPAQCADFEAFQNAVAKQEEAQKQQEERDKRWQQIYDLTYQQYQKELQDSLDKMNSNFLQGLLDQTPTSPKPTSQPPAPTATTPPPAPTEDPLFTEFMNELQNALANEPPPQTPLTINNVAGYGTSDDGRVVVLTGSGSIKEYFVGPGGVKINWTNGIEGPPDFVPGPSPPPSSGGGKGQKQPPGGKVASNPPSGGSPTSGG